MSSDSDLSGVGRAELIERLQRSRLDAQALRLERDRARTLAADEALAKDSAMRENAILKKLVAIYRTENAARPVGLLEDGATVEMATCGICSFTRHRDGTLVVGHVDPGCLSHGGSP